MYKENSSKDFYVISVIISWKTQTDRHAVVSVEWMDKKAAFCTELGSGTGAQGVLKVLEHSKVCVYASELPSVYYQECSIGV